jgi:VanZ family protein
MPTNIKNILANKHLSTYWKYRLPAILWAVFILILSLSPTESAPKIHIPYFDKFVHFCMYAVFAAALLFDFYKENARYSRVKTLIVTSFYGLFTEWLQTFTSYRSFEWADFIANVLGALTIVLFYVKKSK